MKNSILADLALSPATIDKIARRVGWLRRRGRGPLTAPTLVAGVVAAIAGRFCSLREIAVEVGLLSGGTVSKQGLWKRLDANAVELFKALVARALSQATAPALELAAGLRGVGRVLVGDSSTLSLHASLAGHFPGAANQTGARCANVRLQLTFDLLTGRWLHAGIEPYKRNDRAASTDIVTGGLVRAGDLVVRDLGYACDAAFRAIGAAGAFFLSRLPQVSAVLDGGGEQLDLLALARRLAPAVGGTGSRDILLGRAGRLPCRLLVTRVPAEVAAQRRRHLNEEARRRGRKPPRKAYMKQQNWTFMVTNLGEEQVTAAGLHELYALRWRVENIFKFCKSQTNLPAAAGHRTNRYHAEVLLWGWLLMMVSLAAAGIFRLAREGGAGGAPPGKLEVVEESIFKSGARLIALLACSIQLAWAGSHGALLRRLAQQQSYHDRYEQRRRRSMPDRLRTLLETKESHHGQDSLS